MESSVRLWRRCPSQERMIAKARSEGTLVMGISAYQAPRVLTVLPAPPPPPSARLPVLSSSLSPIIYNYAPPPKTLIPRRRGGASHWQPRRRPEATGTGSSESLAAGYHGQPPSGPSPSHPPGGVPWRSTLRLPSDYPPSGTPSLGGSGASDWQ